MNISVPLLVPPHIPGEMEVLLLVDTQNSFACQDGELSVPGGMEIIDPVNSMIGEIRERLGLFIASRDWHPPGHISFASAKKGGTWSDNCVQNTRGAEYPAGLNVNAIDYELFKGYELNQDSYSVFGGKTRDGKTIGQILREYKVRVIHVAGLATDYCVKETVLDLSKDWKKGDKERTIYVYQDGIRAVNVKQGDGENAIKAMQDAGAIIIPPTLQLYTQ